RSPGNGRTMGKQLKPPVKILAEEACLRQPSERRPCYMKTLALILSALCLFNASAQTKYQKKMNRVGGLSGVDTGKGLTSSLGSNTPAPFRESGGKFYNVT